MSISLQDSKDEVARKEPDHVLGTHSPTEEETLLMAQRVSEKRSVVRRLLQ